MAYQTGSYASLNQLLDALRAFCVAHGWTMHRHNAHGNGMQLSISKGGVFAHLKAANNENIIALAPEDQFFSAAHTGLLLQVGNGYDASKAYAWQPGVLTLGFVSGIGSCKALVWTSSLAASGLYHFFSTPTTIYAVIEDAPGVFAYVGFGRLAPYGAGGNARFAIGSQGIRQSLATRYPLCFGASTEVESTNAIIDSGAGWTMDFGSFPDASNGHAILTMSPRISAAPSPSHDDHAIRRSAPSAINGVRPLWPEIVVRNIAGVLRPLGAFPGLMRCNAAGLAPMSEMAASQGTYRVAHIADASYPADRYGVAFRTDM